MPKKRSYQRLVARFRRINIAVFILALVVVVVAMHVAFLLVIREVTHLSAKRYAVSSSEALSAHIMGEVNLLASLTRSQAVRAWLLDENDSDKKEAALAELTDMVSGLYSYNLYIIFTDTFNEYSIKHDYILDDMTPVDTLSRGNPEDEWFFTTLEATEDFVLSIDNDLFLDRKRIWLDYKVMHEGAPIAVISTGLDFAHVVDELFSHFDAVDMSGFVVTAEGYVSLNDSQLTGEDMIFGDSSAQIADIFDPAFVKALNDYHEDRNNEGLVEAVYVRSATSRSYMTIMPIRGTDWSFVIIYDPSLMMSSTQFMPIILVILACLSAFAVTMGFVSHYMLFSPLKKLDESLQNMMETGRADIYGTERQDELGSLSNVIWDLFVKANFDALTGIHNRRYMEHGIKQIISYIGRSDAFLSIIMMDVDNFKKYNDTYGHDEGDKCLKAVASAINEAVTREHDFAARYGGEEFIIVLPNTNEAGARLIAEKALENVRNLQLPHSANTAAPYVTISAGVTTARVVHDKPWEEYVKRADEALYTAKQNGRNQYVFFEFDSQG